MSAKSQNFEVSREPLLGNGYINTTDSRWDQQQARKQQYKSVLYFGFGLYQNPGEANYFVFPIYLILQAALTLGFTQQLTEISTEAEK
jgi:hypothetical protein